MRESSESESFSTPSMCLSCHCTVFFPSHVRERFLFVSPEGRDHLQWWCTPRTLVPNNRLFLGPSLPRSSWLSWFGSTCTFDGFILSTVQKFLRTNSVELKIGCELFLWLWTTPRRIWRIFSRSPCCSTHSFSTYSSPSKSIRCMSMQRGSSFSSECCTVLTIARLTSSCRDSTAT